MNCGTLPQVIIPFPPTVAPVIISPAHLPTLHHASDQKLRCVRPRSAARFESGFLTSRMAASTCLLWLVPRCWVTFQHLGLARNQHQTSTHLEVFAPAPLDLLSTFPNPCNFTHPLGITPLEFLKSTKTPPDVFVSCISLSDQHARQILMLSLYPLLVFPPPHLSGTSRASCAASPVLQCSMHSRTLGPALKNSERFLGSWQRLW